MRSFQRPSVILRYVAVVTLSVLCCIGIAMPVYAEPNSAIAQEFKTGGDGITPGALVGLKKDDSNTVELAEAAKQRQLVGVVAESSAIELSDGTPGTKVVTNGLAMTLVSDVNGSVKAGDKIAPSPIRGIGMKATENGTIVGTSQADLANDTAELRTVTDKSGSKKTVTIALVPVQVNASFYSISSGNNANSSYVPAYLQNIANGIAGRNVSPVRVIAAAIMLLLIIASVAALLYGAVRSSIISIGRNPLSERAVRKSMAQVVVTALGVLAFAGLAVYLILAL